MLEELFRTLGALGEPPGPALAPLAETLDLGEVPRADEYTDLFLFQLYPYASVYLGAEGMLGGEARDRIAGFQRVLGATPPPEPDHLAVLLAFHAEISAREARGDEHRERWRHARRAHLHEHLLSWLPVYLDRLEDLALPFYRRWGVLLAEALAAEVEDLGAPRSLSSHLREVPTLEDPREQGGAAFLASLLAPARSGIILVRDDLLRAGRDLELAARVGERKWVLEALFAQDASVLLNWLAGEASMRAEKTRGVGEIAHFWSERASTTAHQCRDLVSGDL